MTKRNNRIQPQTVIYDHNNRPIPFHKAAKKLNAAGFNFVGGGFKGANDGNLLDWALLPLEINQILRNDLAKLRARSRDLARNDDTARRFLHLVKQNVLGHAGIGLQAKNKDVSGQLDATWNDQIESEWKLFSRKRRNRGAFESPSICGQMSMREIAWLSLWTRVIDGECFIQILPGYPHNRHRFAVRFLNPDLLDSRCTKEADGGNRVDMGIEFDSYGRPVAYHFSDESKAGKTIRIPARQIIHIFRNEYVGQIRGIPDFATIMHKAKMLNGVHEAIVVGWRVAAAKMGFFIPKSPTQAFGEGMDTDENGHTVIDATPGSFEVMKDEYDFQSFDPDYPTSTYEAGNKVFMQQISNGLNVSSPTLSNDYSGVNYSSLRQALLEDREAWRCIQAEMIDGFYQPLFDEWYSWSTDVMGLIPESQTRPDTEPNIVWQPRGWPWVDPLKEVNAHIAAIDANLRTRQSIISESTGADFMDTADELSEEHAALIERGLPVSAAQAQEPKEEPKDNEDE